MNLEPNNKSLSFAEFLDAATRDKAEAKPVPYPLEVCRCRYCILIDLNLWPFGIIDDCLCLDNWTETGYNVRYRDQYRTVRKDGNIVWTNGCTVILMSLSIGMIPMET